MKNEATIGGITVAGQPTDDELRGLGEKYATVINTRMPGETDTAEAPKIPGSVGYHEVGFTSANLSREHVEQVRSALDASKGTALIH